MRLKALQAESQAAVEASDWSTAAQRFEQILALDPDSEFAQDGLRRAREQLGQPETSHETGASEQDVATISVRQLRMYVYVRRAVARLLGRELRETDA